MPRTGSISPTEPTRETVALVIPLFNEAAVVPLLLGALSAYREAHPEIKQVIFVDDGSQDQTAQLIRGGTAGLSGYTLLSFSRNFGHQIAITAGLDFVETDAVVILDADLQDPLSVVSEMIEKWRTGYDVVYGIRRKREAETWRKRITAAGFYRIFRWVTDLDMPVDTGDFRLIGRPVIEAYRRLEEHQPFVRGLIAWLGFNQIGIPYDRAPRVAGETKYPFRKMMRLALNSLTSFSDKPLRLAIRVGFITAISSAIFGFIWVILAKYVYHTAISGWASLLMVVIFFGGLQLFFLGIVGLYLGRVYEEIKGRPRYIIRERWTST